MNDDLSADLVLSVYMDMIKVKAFLFSNRGKRGWGGGRELTVSLENM